MRTGCIRPASGIYGALDNFVFAPALLTGKIVVIASYQVIDYVYVKNVVLGLLLMEKALAEDRPGVAGHGFLVSNNDPLSHYAIYSLMQQLCPVLKFSFMPWPLARLLASISQFTQWLFAGRVSLGELDRLTLPALRVMNAEYTFKCDKAAALLGYKPVYSIEEGVKETVAYYRNLQAPYNLIR